MAPRARVAHRLANRIVQLYPQPWRERYGDEVQSLIEDSPVRFSDLGELARGLVVERARALIEADDRPRRTAAILGALQPTFVIAIICVAWAIGLSMRGWLGRMPDFALAGHAVIVACYGVSVVADYHGRRRGHVDRLPPRFPAVAGTILLPVLFAGIVLTSWGFWSELRNAGQSTPLYLWSQALLYLFFSGSTLAQISSGFWPGQRMLQALGRLAWVEDQMKWAQLWVDGCNTMIAQGVPSPLAEAQAEVGRWSRERDEALEKLRRLGYRARFRS